MPAFAPISNDLSFWKKQTKPLFPDLAWNIPEQKTGTISVVGGNAQSFSGVVRTAEYLTHTFPIKHVNLILPDALRSKLPSLENLSFTASTTSGSFAKSHVLNEYFDSSDFTFLAGDLSHNAETAIAITDAIEASAKPLLISRDGIDLLAPTIGQIIMHPNLIFVCSMPQLQKIFRSLFYPRMITLSSPLVPIVETLHKFTLSYPITILTFHQGNIIVAHAGQVSTTHIVDTNFTPISLWSGQLAAKIVALNLFNPDHPFESTTAAILFG